MPTQQTVTAATDTALLSPLTHAVQNHQSESTFEAMESTLNHQILTTETTETQQAQMAAAQLEGLKAAMSAEEQPAASQILVGICAEMAGLSI